MPLDQSPHKTVIRFLCPKCDNFACLQTRQDQNELHLKSGAHFLLKLASSVDRTSSFQRCSSVYTTIFIRRKDKIDYL